MHPYPPEKGHPIFPSRPSKNWGPGKHLLFENFLGGSMPQQKGDTHCFLTLHRLMNIWMSLAFKQTCVSYVQLCLNIGKQKRLSTFLAKSSQEGEWSSLISEQNHSSTDPSLGNFNRSTPWIISVFECVCAYKVCTKILLHIGNYTKLQYNILR